MSAWLPRISTSLLALLTAACGVSSWTLVRLPVASRCRGLDVVDGQVAWASGTGGMVFRTTDAGQSWSSHPIPGASELDLRDLEAIDDRTAFAMAAGPGEASRIFKTVDGGRSWDTVYRNQDPAGFLDAIAFFDAQHGLALGDPIDGRFTVLRTADGGQTWEPAQTVPAAEPGEAAFAASGTCLTVLGDRLAWFVTGGAEQARVYRTEDAGRTWSVQATPIATGSASSGLFSVGFLDARQGVAVGGDYRDPEAAGVLIRTEDGGRTWSRITAGGLSGYRSAVATVPGQAPPTLVAVGPAGGDISTDGGRHWRRLGPEGFHAVGFAGQGPGTLGLAVGDDGRLGRWTGSGGAQRD